MVDFKLKMGKLSLFRTLPAAIVFIAFLLQLITTNDSLHHPKMFSRTKDQVSPEELGNYIEGDMVFPSSLILRNALRNQGSRWPNKVIPYKISVYIVGDHRRMIMNAINAFHNNTCLKFKKKSRSDLDYVKFTNRRDERPGCWSSVGRVGGKQKIHLQTPECTKKLGTVIHEMLHAVGFVHEQSRPDRNDSVTINFNNIKEGKESNFNIMSEEHIDNQEIGYDYYSVMHYGSHAFSKNGEPTIEPKVRGIVLGQREGFSSKDIQKIRKMYKCDDNN